MDPRPILLDMLPLGDENPVRLTPFVNWSIILASIAVFLWQTSAGDSFFASTLFTFGIIPQEVLAGKGLHTLVTNIFLHGGWSHLGGNMLFLWIFGDNIEDCCGHLRYLAFYLATGVTAAILWIFTVPNSPYPAVGASGAISGVLGAYFVLYPRAKIRTLIGAGLFLRVVRISASASIGLWFVYQLLLAAIPANTGVAYWAHVGGFLAGLALARVIRPRLRMPKSYEDLEYLR